ncbi:MAG: site-2 protease family protein [Ignavibacteria bacterium]|nr:site-2 protease family protein [Ignavibacteria bacterium]
MDALLILPILLFSVVVHEVAHGFMALRLGDATAKEMGRLTLNPIPHIDLFGSILVPLFSYLAAGSVFIAWAKPVPVNPMNFKNVRRDDILVSAVGPISNLVVAMACAFLVGIWSGVIGPVDRSVIDVDGSVLTLLPKMLLIGITLNIYLAVFNLIPVPPLDGSHIVASLLPHEVGEKYRRIGFLGIFALIVLMRVDAFRNVVIAVVKTLHIPYALILGLFS